MIRTESRESVTVLHLEHGKVNAFDTDLARAITESVREVGPERALVLTGSGSVFSAGVDLVRIAESDDGEVAEFLEALETCFLAVFEHPAPTVAAINGHAIAGGAILAAACDRRIFAEGKARIGVPELLVGVPFPPAALEILRHALPRPEFEGAVLLGATVTAGRAADMGWAHEVAPRERVLEKAVTAAERLAALNAPAFALTKAMLRAPAQERMNRARATFSVEMARVWQHPDTRAAIGRYMASLAR